MNRSIAAASFRPMLTMAFFALSMLGLSPVLHAQLPSIDSFGAVPDTIQPGQTASLSWTTTNATSASLSDGNITLTVNVDDSVEVSPTTTTTYTLTARNSSGDETTASVDVVVVPPPVIDSFQVNPETIRAGESATLSWSTSDASTVTISPDIGSVGPSGSISVSPEQTTTFELFAANSLGVQVSDAVTLSVTAVGRLQVLLPGESPAPGSQDGRSGTPSPQVAGRRFNVVVRAVDDVWNLLPNVNDVVRLTSSDRNAELPPAAALIGGTATFTVTLNTEGLQNITATDVSDPGKGSETSSPVNVQSAAAPVVAVALFPAGMISSPDAGGVTDRYALVNTGDVATTITLTQSGNFFTQTPTSFTLSPGQTQTITITSAVQPVGSYRGSSIPRGDGVPPGLSIPVTLLVAVPPVGTPDVRPTRVRIDTDEAVNSGSAEFTNVGTATAHGFFVSDVPWIIPQTTPLSIEPGRSAVGGFTIDRELRGDPEHAAGAQTARFKFVYAAGGSSQRGPVTNANPPTNVSVVTLVDTVGINGSKSAIPGLASNQVARFVLGLARRSGRIADVSFVNASPASFSDFRFYFVPSGKTSALAKAATISQLAPNLPVGLGDVLGSVFGETTSSGSVQFRTRIADPFAARAVLLYPAAAGLIGTSLSLFRSDTGATSGQDFILTGLRKDANTRTDIYIQESSGSPATAQIEFFDDRGRSVAAGRLPDSIAPFAQLELTDIVPAGAVRARITTRAGSAGRLVAEAHVVEAAGDLWNVVDSSRQSGFARTSPVVIPFAASTSSHTTELVITNTSAVAASGTLSGPPSASRRRAVGALGEDVPVVTAAKSQTLAFAPGETRVVSDPLRGTAGLSAGRGYLRFTPAVGEFVVTSRTAMRAANGTIGSSVPSIALSSALKKGARRHLSGIEDASSENVSDAVAGTYRSAIGIVETANAEVTVRITLRYTYPLAKISAVTQASREFTLRPSQFLMIDDLGRSILGPARDQLGDLHNLQIDLEVVNGNGAVVPYVLTTENGSGDIHFTPML